MNKHTDKPMSYGQMFWQFVEIAGGLIAVIGIGLFLFQVYLWLQYGEWAEMPLLLIFMFMPDSIEPLANWLNYPKSWIGISNAIKYFLIETSVTIFLFFVGASINVYSGYQKEKFNEPESFSIENNS